MNDLSILCGFPKEERTCDNISSFYKSDEKLISAVRLVGKENFSQKFFPPTNHVAKIIFAFAFHKQICRKEMGFANAGQKYCIILLTRFFDKMLIIFCVCD